MSNQRDERSPRKENRGERHVNNYTAYDRALIKAAQEEKEVLFSLANGTFVTGKVRSVDRFQVAVDTEGTYHPVQVWVNKSQVITTKIGE